MVNERVPETDRSVLTGTGLRVTRQRALLLDIIRQGGEHLDAFELYRRAREKESRLNLSTVYRALQKFKELGLVKEAHLDDTHHHYEVKQASEHHHLVCLGCGRIIEFRYPLARQIKKNVTAVKGFDIVDTEVRMTGYCPKCRQNRK